MKERKKMSSFLNHPSNSDDSFQNFLSHVLKMLAVGMTLSSFTAYLTAKYISLLSIPIIPLPSTSSLSNISVITRTSFLLLLVVSFVADDGHSKLNLNRPKGGLLLFSVLFGIFLGSMLEEIISSFLTFYLGGAFFFFIVGLYKSWFRQAENSLESFILGKYFLIFMALLQEIVDSFRLCKKLIGCL